jgi:hypothetical protein
MKIKIYNTTHELGVASGKKAAQLIREAIET